MEVVNEKAASVNLKGKSRKEFFLIHGYTGSPTDFNNLARYLNRKFNANVRVIRLKGHGTKIEDLDNVEYEHLIEQIESEFLKELKNKKEIIVGGLSFGAHVALILAAKYKVRGAFIASIPYFLRFPLNTPFADLMGRFKKRWEKKTGTLEKRLRKNSFRYEYMHYKGLKINAKARKHGKKLLNKIKCPIMIIHSRNDSLGHPVSANFIERRVESKVKRKLILNSKIHNLFFSEDREKVIKEIGNFASEVFESEE